MTKQSHDCGRLEGTEAFGLYLTEIASSVLAISQQSALLLQALSERAVLLADVAGQAENAESATSQMSGKPNNVVRLRAPRATPIPPLLQREVTKLPSYKPLIGCRFRNFAQKTEEGA
jgi:hypothetical protein